MLGRNVDRLYIPKEKVMKRVEIGYLREIEMRNGKRIGLLFIPFGTIKIRSRKENLCKCIILDLKYLSCNKYIRFHQNL